MNSTNLTLSNLISFTARNIYNNMPTPPVDSFAVLRELTSACDNLGYAYEDLTEMTTDLLASYTDKLNSDPTAADATETAAIINELSRYATAK